MQLEICRMQHEKHRCTRCNLLYITESYTTNKSVYTGLKRQILNTIPCQLFGSQVHSFGGQVKECIHGNGLVLWQVAQGGDGHFRQVGLHSAVQDVLHCLRQLLQISQNLVPILDVCKGKPSQSAWIRLNGGVSFITLCVNVYKIMLTFHPYREVWATLRWTYRTSLATVRQPKL